MPGKAFRRVYAFARRHHNMITVERARELGVSAAALRAMNHRGMIHRVFLGVYRLACESVNWRQRLEAYRLWTRQEEAVLSHRTALYLCGIVGSHGRHVDVTVPLGTRIRRVAPKNLRIHRADLAWRDIRHVDGIACSAPERAIYEEHLLGRDPRQTQYLIGEAYAQGWMSRVAAEKMLTALFAHRLEQRGPSDAFGATK